MINEIKNNVEERKDFYEKWINYTRKYDAYGEYIELKSKHMLEVVSIMDVLSYELGLDKRLKELAFIIALFHDVGRYEQIKRYNLFNDVKSADHGDLSADIIGKENFLDGLSEKDKNIVTRAIKNHNKLVIEDGLDDETLFLSKLIRDADKVDIFRVVEEESYKNTHSIFAETLEDSVISDNVFFSIMNHQNVKYSDCVTPLDMTLAYTAFVFDINFRETMKIIKEKNYLCGLDKLKILNPETEKRLNILINEIKMYVE